MKENHIIVSESDRPLWQIVLATCFFTFAVALILEPFYTYGVTISGLLNLLNNAVIIALLLAFGASFCSQKIVYLDLTNNRFKPATKIGPVVLGTWQEIENPKYVSIFYRIKKNNNYMFEVNLWHGVNKRLEIYESEKMYDAFEIGFLVADKLQIRLLDSTIHNKRTWLNKKTWLENLQS